jgi:putative zinc finger/helix-turn-helix YgiT family protein
MAATTSSSRLTLPMRTLDEVMTMNRTALFEYTCPECEIGTVNTTRVLNYQTKIKGYPFVVDEAFIGVCNNCGAESFAPEELKRWEELFSRRLESQRAFLSPQEITELRTELNLSMEDFARLVGCTRQSISAWEKPERNSAPSRMADLLMKLLRHSLREGRVSILSLLLEEAKKWGVVIEVRQRSAQRSQLQLVLRPRDRVRSTRVAPDNAMPLAARSEAKGQLPVEMQSDDGSISGTLVYDYQSAALSLHLARDLALGSPFDVQLETTEGELIHATGRQTAADCLILKEKTKNLTRNIASVRISPHNPSDQGHERKVD